MMAATEFSAFLPDVMPYVDGCSDAVAKNAVRNAAIEFCERSWAYQFEAPIVLTPGTVLDLDPPKNTLVHLVLEITAADGEPLTPTTRDDLNRGRILRRRYATDAEDSYYTYSTDWMTLTGTPECYFQPTRRRVRFVPQPASAQNGTLLMALKPTKSATAIDTQIFEDYFEVIALGARARLLTMPRKNWTDFQLGKDSEAAFYRGVSAAKVRAIKNNTRAPLRTRSYY